MPEIESTLPPTWNPKVARSEEQFVANTTAIVIGLRNVPPCHWSYASLFVGPWTAH